MSEFSVIPKRTKSAVAQRRDLRKELRMRGEHKG